MIASVVAPFRALFIALFFVSVGMLLDPRAVVTLWVPIVAAGALFVAFRFGLWVALARTARMTPGEALAVGTAMTALGEFNVVLIDEALRAHRLDAREQQLLLGITFFSIIVTVVLGPYVARTFAHGEAPAHELEGFVPQTHAPRVSVLGFGRVGATVGATLERAGVPYAILDRDRTIVERARAQGRNAVLGDALDPVALERVVVPSTRVVLTTVPNLSTNVLIAKRLAARPHLDVLARAVHTRDIPALREGGAASALVPEAEGALVFASVVLRAVGVPDDEIVEQLVRARRDTRAETP